MRTRGFSLLELTIALAIIAAISTLGIRSMIEGTRREHLLKTANQVVDLLRVAQAEAKLYGEVRGACFRRDAQGKESMTAYRPVIAASSILPSDQDCDASEQRTGPTVDFGAAVRICASNCDSKVNHNRSIFFDKDGYTMQADGARAPYEICLVNPLLPSGTRAREIEAGVNGDIQLVPQTGNGVFSGVVANQGNCL